MVSSLINSSTLISTLFSSDINLRMINAKVDLFVASISGKAMKANQSLEKSGFLQQKFSNK